MALAFGKVFFNLSDRGLRRADSDLPDPMIDNGELSGLMQMSSLGEGIQILSAVNRRAEVEGVARELRRLARDEGLCWNEMAIMSS